MTTAAMAIGIGADYEIYLLFRSRGTGADRQRARGHACLDADVGQGDPARGDFNHRRLLVWASEFAFYNTLASMVTATMVIGAFFALFFLRR